MKKLFKISFAILAVSSLVFMFSGCKQSTTTTTDEQSNPTDQSVVKDGTQTTQPTDQTKKDQQSQ